MAVEGIQPDLFVGLSHYCRICSIRLLSAEVKLEWVRDPLARCLHKRTPVTRHTDSMCVLYKELRGCHCCFWLWDIETLFKRRNERI